MNSFNTQRDTDSYLRKISKRELKIFTFEQNRFPRLLEETSLPFAKSMQLKQEYDPAWYPPGHGDLYRCFYESGLLKKFISEGKTWAFVSNIDNLGATADPTILCYLEEQRKNQTSKQADFVMEVTPKTLSDIKGGTLVPPEHMDDFLSVRKFNIFNTNNLWVNLESLYSALLKKRLQMDLIINRKTLPDGMRIIQLEEASGAAIKSFERPMGLRVPRSRFLPVKVTSDLMLLMSDLYIWRSGQLLPSPLRNFPTLPIVKLGKHFEKMRDFEKHMSKVPSMIELYHLTVSGNVTFGKDVVLKGTVIIIAQDNEQIDIPNGSVLENKVVTGNLRIVNH
ncbi:unnamed protein product [Schistocephalus solidus]|uniref:UTP--glucose-1-phosphate uridylyltransferase n=1 Tax=Schistocephalus solidus TaxID=70667 RepID=A0A183S7C2_SCHSO|nr:unnamed protein product [Schistocephalus solidus]